MLHYLNEFAHSDGLVRIALETLLDFEHVLWVQCLEPVKFIAVLAENMALVHSLLINRILVAHLSSSHRWLLSLFTNKKQ